MPQRPTIFEALVSMYCLALSGCSDSGTTYAPSYTEERFHLVRLGMQTNDVIRLLGSPLRIDHLSVSERWWYERASDTAQPSDGQGLVGKGVLNQNASVISFNSEGVVIGQVNAAIQLEGCGRFRVERELGKPTKIESNLSGTILNYSLGTYSGSHNVRAVILDEAGRVAGKRAFYYQD